MQEFLAKQKVKPIEQVDAKKSKLNEKDALKLIQQVDHLYATKGKQVIHLNLKKERPDKAALLSLLLGPTGNLRAPVVRIKRVLLVGFDAGTYETVLKK